MAAFTRLLILLRSFSMFPGIVLVHGYSGSPDTLSPLATKLAAHYGPDAVTSVCLSGHGPGHDQAPAFDQAAFIHGVAAAISAIVREGRQVIVLGHSTGGTIALAALEQLQCIPALLVLASVPKQIAAASLERWGKHRKEKSDIPFVSVANMVSLINSVGAKPGRPSFPVLLLQGAEDELVPAQDVRFWEQGCFEGPLRTVVIPGAGHDLFQGDGNFFAIDVVLRAVRDHTTVLLPAEERALDAITSAEPEIGRFLARSRSSRRHIVRCPSGCSVIGAPPSLGPVADIEPVFANIEITTRCNLRCTYCARTASEVKGADMSRETFVRLLGLLPHASRITFVGLGETLLHPQVAEFVALASAEGRRTALVTNGMLLDRALSRRLLNAGLDSITFSIDGADQAVASEVRPGTDLARVTDNIRAFKEISRTTRPIATSVFSAVSTRTIGHLEALMDLVAGLGVHVVMLTDLNFPENVKDSLWHNADDRIARLVRKGVARAFRQQLPVLSVRGLEEFGLAKRYEKYLLLPPDSLATRSPERAWCCSPWQTVPVSVTGEVTLCDCQPGVRLGNLLDRPLNAIWNGAVIQEHRQRMSGPEPPEACRICPRF
jgi:MoaA/NifB/PqqE/SkfB family radical SAM enzyme/pimeloyl-ACP methyl ester carboxylesterase